MIRRNQKFLTQLYMVADFLVIQVAFLAAWWLKFKSGLLESYRTLPVSPMRTGVLSTGPSLF